jgi:hypothetical protein
MNTIQTMTYKDLNVSLDENISRIHFVQMGRFKFTGRLAKVEGDKLTFVRKNGMVVIVNQKDLLTLCPIGGDC